MKTLKVLGVLVVLAGVVVLALVVPPSVHGQRAESPERRGRALTVLAGRGAEIGVSIRDIESSDNAGGVVIEEGRKDGPADKTRLKQADVIVEVDGEQLPSARQFTRLVQE